MCLPVRQCFQAVRQLLVPGGRNIVEKDRNDGDSASASECRLEFQPHPIVGIFQSRPTALVASRQPRLADDGDQIVTRFELSHNVISEILTRRDVVHVEHDLALAERNGELTGDAAGRIAAVFAAVGNGRSLGMIAIPAGTR